MRPRRCNSVAVPQCVLACLGMPHLHLEIVLADVANQLLLGGAAVEALQIAFLVEQRERRITTHRTIRCALRRPGKQGILNGADGVERDPKEQIFGRQQGGATRIDGVRVSHTFLGIVDIVRRR